MKNIYVVLSLVFVFSCASTMKRLPSDTANGEVKMDLQLLKQKALSQCQLNYIAPKFQPVPMLDPPNGGLEAEGMAFQEELSVRTRNLLDQDGFYFSPRPRAAVNSIPMDIYVDTKNSGSYSLKTWEDAEVDYTSNIIQPKIDKNLIPEAGRILTEIVIGHRSPSGDYPQLFDLRSSAYFRFAGYPPQITGASLRLGANKIAGLGEENKPGVREDFPVVRAIYASIESPRTAKVLASIESELFCGALEMRMTEGASAEVIIDSFWFTREDFNWQKNPHAAFVAYSSMLWKTEKQTPEIANDEAHDSDTLHIEFADHTVKRKINLQPVTGPNVRVRDLTAKNSKAGVPVVAVTSWSLANEDREPAHYSEFQPALGNTNYPFRASYKVEILESSIKTGVSLYEMQPDKEYKDNLVVASTIREDIKKATAVDQAVHFKYRTTAY